MHTVALALAGALKVLVAGLLLGAGLPAIFAVGVRALAFGRGGDAEAHPSGAVPRPHPVGVVVAGLCFTIVVLAIVIGIAFIVATGFGKTISFAGGFPTMVDKH